MKKLIIKFIKSCWFMLFLGMANVIVAGAFAVLVWQELRRPTYQNATATTALFGPCAIGTLRHLAKCKAGLARYTTMFCGLARSRLLSCGLYFSAGEAMSYHTDRVKDMLAANQRDRAERDVLDRCIQVRDKLILEYIQEHCVDIDFGEIIKECK